MTTLQPTAGADPGFGVYVHWPFCLSKCPYCDFNSHVRPPGADEVADEGRFLAALTRDLAHRAALTRGRTVASVFFGGGTPSLMRASTVGAILEAIAGHWPIAPEAEITLEANPTSVEAERFRGFRAAGVNRVSLGVQALNDADLRALGRAHSSAGALAAVALAGSIFERTSFDLIYARPRQSVADWRAELAAALGQAGDHLSLYQLTIEPDTPFERWRADGKLTIPGPDLGRDFWDATQEIMGKAGLPAYEISNHARPGAESRHNLIYWRYGEYAGVGPGAHGRIIPAVAPRGRLAQACERDPAQWLAAVAANGHGLVEDSPLTPEEIGDEFLLMGLRLAEGVEPARFEALSGRALDPRRLAALIEGGLIERARGRIRVTAEGFPVLDAVVADLAA
jgi:oxygen-independent coproporphyrinogen-3 oxidase